jgi:hypothetical protein
MMAGCLMEETMHRSRILRNAFAVGLTLLVAIAAFSQNGQERLATKLRIQQADAACGGPSAKFTVQPGALIQPTVSIGKDEARVYILDDTVIPFQPGQHLSGAATIKVGLNGQWIGATKGRSYIALPVQAGEDHFCGRVQLSRFRWPAGCFMVGNTALLQLHVVAGQTYYVRARAYKIDLGDDGFLCAVNLDTVNPDEGKLLLAESLPAVWKKISPPKQHPSKTPHP